MKKIRLNSEFIRFENGRLNAKNAKNHTPC